MANDGTKLSVLKNNCAIDINGKFCTRYNLIYYNDLKKYGNVLDLLTEIELKEKLVNWGIDLYKLKFMVVIATN